jgi:hypothetical protein
MQVHCDSSPSPALVLRQTSLVSVSDRPDYQVVGDRAHPRRYLSRDADSPIRNRPSPTIPLSRHGRLQERDLPRLGPTLDAFFALTFGGDLLLMPFIVPPAQETRIEQERRAGLIDRLLNEANRQGEKTIEKTPIKETAPAK